MIVVYALAVLGALSVLCSLVLAFVLAREGRSEQREASRDEATPVAIILQPLEAEPNQLPRALREAQEIVETHWR